MLKKIIAVISICICSLMLASCVGDDTYKLAKKMHEYEIKETGYKETLKMAEKGNYDANCKDCFKGMDTQNISLFAYACKVDMDFAQAIYENGADIEVSNSKFEQTPLLAALDGNRDNTEIVYWLIEEGADIDAIDYDDGCVFYYLRYWEDNEDTQELISYFKENCDMKYLEKNTKDNKICSWDDMWDENGEFVFYEGK